MKNVTKPAITSTAMTQTRIGNIGNDPFMHEKFQYQLDLMRSEVDLVNHLRHSIDGQVLLLSHCCLLNSDDDFAYSRVLLQYLLNFSQLDAIALYFPPENLIH